MQPCPKPQKPRFLGKQLLRSGASVGAHYREACRAKSNADFISKIEDSFQELDETTYWLELLSEGQIIAPNRLQSLEVEANELIAMFVTMAKGMKQGGKGVRVKKHPSSLRPHPLIQWLNTTKALS